MALLQWSLLQWSLLLSSLLLSLLLQFVSANSEIRFPDSESKARAIIHTLEPIDVNLEIDYVALRLTFEAKMDRRTARPYLFSYASPDEPNEFSLWLPGAETDSSYGYDNAGTSVRLQPAPPFPEGSWVPILLQIRRGAFHHVYLTATINSTTGYYHSYIKTRLRNGGKLVLGQRLQDFEETRFSVDERFVGAVRNIRLHTEFARKGEPDERIAPRIVPLVEEIPTVELKEGAVASGVVARCGGADRGILFSGNQTESRPSGAFDTASCRDECGKSDAAKGWSLSSAGECVCFNRIAKVLRKSDFYSASYLRLQNGASARFDCEESRDLT